MAALVGAVAVKWTLSTEPARVTVTGRSAAAVEKNAFRLPDGEFLELLGKSFGIAGEFEGFEGEDG